MSPQDMMKMIRGGNNAEQQIQKDVGRRRFAEQHADRAGTDPLFEEVKALVDELDQSLVIRRKRRGSCR